MSSLPKLTVLHPAPPAVQNAHILCGGCGALIHLGLPEADTLVGECISCVRARTLERPSKLKAFVRRYPDLCAIAVAFIAAGLWLAAVVAFL
jgi:hypothetical protein